MGLWKQEMVILGNISIPTTLSHNRFLNIWWTFMDQLEGLICWYLCCENTRFLSALWNKGCWLFYIALSLSNKRERSFYFPTFFLNIVEKKVENIILYRLIWISTIGYDYYCECAKRTKFLLAVIYWWLLFYRQCIVVVRR